MTKQPCKNALFFDFDGTLYVNGRISYACRRELARVRGKGNLIVLNTGRSYGFLPEGVREDPLFDAMICGSSYVSYRGEVIENITVSEEILRTACDWGNRTGKCVVFEGVCENFSKNGEQRDAEEIFRRPVLPQITKVTMWCDPALVRDEDFPGLRLVRFRNYAEGIIQGRDKSSGMKTLLERVGLTAKDAVAFGDSENDLDMLRFAGRAVCMANAPASFDEFCVYRCKDPDGVPEALSFLFPDN